MIQGPLIPLAPSCHSLPISKKYTWQRTGVVPKAGDAAGSFGQLSPQLLTEGFGGARATSPSCSVFLHRQSGCMKWPGKIILYSLSYSITRPV